nr:replication protein A 70 kDa DNA-binding subunit [Tanacetum cinerariifolium]
MFWNYYIHSEDVVELTLWDEMAKSFKEEFDSMPRPVIFAVSSCKVSKYGGALQLPGTSATHYYLNPEIPKLEELHVQFVAKYNLHPPLEISKTKYADPSKEKDKNKFPMSTLLQQNPDSYKVDFYFDDILDKPLQITGTYMSALKGTGESSEMTTGSSAPGTPSQLMKGTPMVTATNELVTPPLSFVSDIPAIETPLEHTTGTPGIATPLEHITESSPSKAKEDPENPKGAL